MIQLLRAPLGSKGASKRAIGPALLFSCALWAPSVMAQPRHTTPIVGADNRAPRWIDVGAEVTVRAKEHLEHSFRAEDPEHDPLTYRISGLPMGARAEERDGAIVVDWTPEDGEVGTWEIELDVSDGRQSASRRVRLVVEEETNSFVMPGVEYLLYVPNNTAGYGVFQGVSAQFDIWNFVHRNEKRGPSHGRIYFTLDLGASTEKAASALFVAAAGFSLSIEKNPSRRFLIPYFGAEMGIYFQKQAETLAVATPILGVYLWSGANVQLVLHAGYLLPFSSGKFDDVRGLSAGLGAHVALW